MWGPSARVGSWYQCVVVSMEGISVAVDAAPEAASSSTVVTPDSSMILP